MSVILRISRSARDAMFAHCAASPRVEACGLLLGAGDVVTDARPTPNIAENPARFFEIDPQALFAAIRAARAGGPSLIGHYHSHPHGNAEPSAHDAMLALDPGRIWIIVSGRDCRAWRVVAPHRFDAVELRLASDDGEGP